MEKHIVVLLILVGISLGFRGGVYSGEASESQRITKNCSNFEAFVIDEQKYTCTKEAK